MLKLEKISDKTLLILGTTALISIGGCIDLVALQNVLTDRAAESFNAWFQFTFGNWPKWEGILDRRSSYFCAAIVFKFLLGVAPIVGIFTTLGKLMVLERKQIMTLMDLVKIRDRMIKTQFLGKIHPEQREKIEKDFIDAYNQASKRWADQQLATLLGNDLAKSVIERLEQQPL